MKVKVNKKKQCKEVKTENNTKKGKKLESKRKLKSKGVNGKCK